MNFINWIENYIIMKKINTYRELEVWQESMNLVEMIYKNMKSLPKEELYGLVSQIQRAVVSIPSNIAEGWGRMSKKESKRFCSIARGSAMELETQLIITVRLNFLCKDDMLPIWKQLQIVNRLLNGVIRSLNNEIAKQNKISESMNKK